MSVLAWCTAENVCQLDCTERGWEGQDGARLQGLHETVTDSSSSPTLNVVDSSHPAFRQVSALVKETKQTTTEALRGLVANKL